MTFEDLYNKVCDLDCDGNYSPFNVCVRNDEGRLTIVNNITVETSADGAGKYVLLHTVRS